MLHVFFKSTMRRNRGAARFALCLSLGPFWQSLAWSATEGEAATSSETQPDDVVTRARSHYDRGLELAASGDSALALIEFGRAYQLVPNFRVLYNIGQLNIQLSHYSEAYQALTAYLAQGGDQIPPDRVAQVRADLNLIERRTAHLTIVCNVVGAEVYVDDVLAGTTPLTEPLRVDAGERRVRVSKDGYTARSERVILAGKDERRVELELKAVETSTRTIVVREREADRGPSTLVLSSWIATGALATGAIITGVIGAGHASDLKELRRSPGDASLRNKLDRTESKARTMLLTSDILSGTALLAGGVSLWLSLGSKKTPSTDETQPSAPLQVGFHQGLLQVRGHF
jgi:hypothetical protein